jgi:rhamnosyltransferase
MNPEVCATIITYHPDENLENSIALLRPQVGSLVVVDNRSSDEEVVRLCGLATQYNFTLIENKENYGIGTALNQAIRWAESQLNFRFILFFDQDSAVSSDFVDHMLATYHTQSEPERIFLVTCTIVHRRTGTIYLPWKSNGRFLVAQTSGALMPLAVIGKCGLYREDLFIDFVDYEYCLRVATRGWQIAYCPQATLLHEPGNAEEHFLPGGFKVTTANLSPLRGYYSLRNGLWTLRTYALRQPRWAFHTAWEIAKANLRILLFEKERVAKFRMRALGVRDMLCGTLGKFPDD